MRTRLALFLSQNLSPVCCDLIIFLNFFFICHTTVSFTWNSIKKKHSYFFPSPLCLTASHYRAILTIDLLAACTALFLMRSVTHCNKIARRGSWQTFLPTAHRMLSLIYKKYWSRAPECVALLQQIKSVGMPRVHYTIQPLVYNSWDPIPLTFVTQKSLNTNRKTIKWIWFRVHCSSMCCKRTTVLYDCFW